MNVLKKLSIIINEGNIVNIKITFSIKSCLLGCAIGW